MRYGIVSDVHANLEALTRVVAELDRRKVDALICLGDSVGYHADPNPCLELLRGAGTIFIAGNHDRAAIRRIEPHDFGRTARHAIHWTRRVLEPEHAAFLGSLGVFRTLDPGVCLVHAALHPEPNDRWHLSKPDRIAASFSVLCSGSLGPARLCFFGHTHRPAVHRSDGRNVHCRNIQQAPATVALDDAFYLVNPGSVGQPRDGDPRASFAVYDSAAHCLEFHRADYDLTSCLRKAEAAGLLRPPPTFFERTRAAALGVVRSAFSAAGAAVRTGAGGTARCAR